MRPAATAVAFVVLVAVHAVLGLPMHQPHIFPDELAYLGHARYLAGAGPMPDMGSTHFYHFGYSLLIAPAFALSGDPAVVYRAVVLLNALLLSAVFPLLHATLHRLLGVPWRPSIGASFVAALYPASLLQSNFAWAENALIPGYALVVAVFARLACRPALTPALLLGALSAFMYTVHPRALPLLPVTALSLGALSLRRMMPWRHTAAALGVMVLVFAATGAANERLYALGWSPEREATAAADFLARAGTPSRIAGAAIAALGQLLYLSQATYGLFLLPIAWLLSFVRRHGAHAVPAAGGPHVAATAGFVLLSSLALFATSCLVMSTGGTRSDHLLYGRYNEAFLPLWLAAGLLVPMMTPAAARRMERIAVPSVIAALTAVLLVAWGGEVAARDFVAPNIFGIYPLVRPLGRVSLPLISAVSILLFLLLRAAFERGARAGLLAVAIVFTAGALYGHQYATSAQEWIATRDDVPSRIRLMGGVQTVSYELAPAVRQDMDFSDERTIRFFSSQFLLPSAQVRRFSSERGEPPSSPLVIASRRWPDAERLDARFVTSERNADIGLWLLPASPHYFSASQRYADVALGWRWFPGVWESGFHAPERGRRRFRWTNGRARLVVPVHEFPVRLVTDLSPSSPDGRVRILVNGVELWNGPYPPGRRSFDLGTCPVADRVTVEILSDTVIPRNAHPGSTDGRTLGVAVREIRLASG